MDGVYEAFQKNYVVCGTYEKRTGMVVRDGQIIDGGKTIGTDSRMTGMEGQNFKRQAPGAWVFGCTFALPVEWMLQVNGFDESWDSVSMEDVHFGRMLENNSFPIFFDSRMKMIEDRSGTEIYPKNREHDMKRSSKERHPHDKNDKTHKLIDMLWGNKRSAHAWDLTTIRNNILSGKSYPIPRQPTHDFFDSQPLIEMT